MRPPITEPTRTVNPSMHVEERLEHPAFAQIQAAHVSGDQVLYGSDFLHHNTIRISIHKSVLDRMVSHDWPHATLEPYIEVELSESQWATFVSSLNVGTGVQCTMTYRNGRSVEALPPPRSRTAQFTAELRNNFARIDQEVAQLRKEIDALKISEKAKDALRDRLIQIENNLSPNTDFLMKTFGKHVENVTEQAKVEINAHINAAIMRSGVAALQGQPAPFSLPAQDAIDSNDKEKL